MKSIELILLNVSRVARISFNIFGKPLFKLIVVIEELRHDKVKQSPKLCHGVLDRSSCQKKLVSRLEAEKSVPS
jgi:hypothetical protein